MFTNRLNRLLFLSKFSENYLKSNSVLMRNGLNRRERWVHSSDTHEIDYLLTKYKLWPKTRVNGCQGYGQKSALHHFNTIDDFNFETEKDITIETLKRVLDIRKTDANYLVRHYPNLVDISAERLESHIIRLSERFSTTSDHFLSCPWILYLPLNFITERLNTFGRKDTKKDDLVLLLLPLKTFESIVKKIKKNKFRKNIFNDFELKLKLFTKNLHLIEEEFCDLLHENLFLFHYEFERLETVMSLLVSAGIESETIIGDLRVFTHNIDIMKERISECLEHNMPVKTWMLRSPDEPFRVSLRRHVENKKVLKDYDSNIEYMAQQLKCEKRVIHSIMKRYPRIVRISAKKLCEKLTFLFGNGFTSYHIVDTPKILFHSTDTVAQRVRQLEELNIQFNSLKVLTLSDKEYQKLCQQLKSIRIDVNSETNDEKKLFSIN